jgi:hypothetical protein
LEVKAVFFLQFKVPQMGSCRGEVTAGWHFLRFSFLSYCSVLLRTGWFFLGWSQRQEAQ